MHCERHGGLLNGLAEFPGQSGGGGAFLNHAMGENEFSGIRGEGHTDRSVAVRDRERTVVVQFPVGIGDERGFEILRTAVGDTVGDLDAAGVAAVVLERAEEAGQRVDPVGLGEIEGEKRGQSNLPCILRLHESLDGERVMAWHEKVGSNTAERVITSSIGETTNHRYSRRRERVRFS